MVLKIITILHKQYSLHLAAPAVEFANKLAASGSKNPVMVLKGENLSYNYI